MPNDRCHANQNARIVLRDLVDSTKGDIKVSKLVNELNKRDKNASFVQTGLELCCLVWVVWKGLEGVFGGKYE